MFIKMYTHAINLNKNFHNQFKPIYAVKTTEINNYQLYNVYKYEFKSLIQNILHYIISQWKLEFDNLICLSYLMVC